MGETYEAPQDHTLADFGPHPRYTTEGKTFSGVPILNALGGLSINHYLNPYILQGEEGLLL